MSVPHNLRRLCAGLIAFAWVVVAAGPAISGQSQAANQGRRLALVIGNDAYPAMPLRNAVNDARAVAAALERLGFRSELITNTTYRDLGVSVDRFIAQLGPGDVPIIYYAGHGIQIEGENYLLPIDFEAKDEADAKYAAYSAMRLADRLASAGVRLNILVLDACRNNPFRVTRSATRGLAAMNGGAGSLIAFATAPGGVAADDSEGRTNGLFTSALLAALEEPGLSVEEVFARVREEVYSASGGRQLPYVTTSVIGKFYLTPPVSASGRTSVETPAGMDRPMIPAPRSTVTVAPGVIFTDRSSSPEEDRIRETLAAYVAALEGKRVPAVRDVWPTADRAMLERLFMGAQSIDLTLTCESVRLRSADSADVQCVSVTTIQRTRGDSPSAIPVQQTIYFKRSGSRWVIDRLES